MEAREKEMLIILIEQETQFYAFLIYAAYLCNF